MRSDADREVELPEIAETPLEARQIVDGLTGVREALGLASANGLVVAYMIILAGYPVVPVVGLTAAHTVGCLALGRYFDREAKRRTAPFRNPIDGQLRSDVPETTPADRAARRRIMGLALAAYATVAALLLTGTVRFE